MSRDRCGLDPQTRCRSVRPHGDTTPTATAAGTTTREVKAIDQEVKLNRALWHLAERMAELKSAYLGPLPTTAKVASGRGLRAGTQPGNKRLSLLRSEEHTSELQSLR